MADYLPAGAHFVVVASPAELMSAPATRAVIDSLVPAERFDQFQVHSGIDPRTIDALAYAEYRDEAGSPIGTVLVVRGPFHAAVAVSEMGNRMIPLESQRDAPYMRRSGIYATARRDAIAVDVRTLMVVTGSPVLSEAALDLHGARALGEAGRSLLSESPAPLVALWPQPLELPAGTDVALLFAREEALALSFSSLDETRVGIEAQARGEFPPGILENLRALVHSLTATDMGHRLGMAELEATLQLSETDHAVHASGALSAATLASGLRALLIAEIAEIVGPAPL